MSDFDERTEEFQRKILDEKINKLSGSQHKMFKKIYPGLIPPEKLKEAYDLCQRTIERTKREQAFLSGTRD